MDRCQIGSFNEYYYDTNHIDYTNIVSIASFNIVSTGYTNHHSLLLICDIDPAEKNGDCEQWPSQVVDDHSRL